MYSFAVKFSRLVLCFFLSFSLLVVPARSSDVPTSADTVSLFYDPDFPLPAGQTLAAYYTSKRYLYVYREIVPIEGGGNTFFNVLGSNAGDYPEFFGGIQTFKDGRPNAAIFSAWDKRAYCTDCAPGSTETSKQVSIVAKGLRTETRPFGYQGTGITSLINNFDWKYGEKISMLAVVEPTTNGYLLSAAIKRAALPWEFIISFNVPAPFITGMPGNYAFLQDFGGDPKIKRSFLVGPSILEDDAGSRVAFTNVFVSAYNSSISSATRHSIELDGSWIKVTTGIEVQANTAKEYRFQLPKPINLTDFTEGKLLLAKQVVGKTLRNSPIDVGKIKKPNSPVFSGINFVDNQVIVNVEIGSSANRPSRVFLVAPKLGIESSNPLPGVIDGNVAAWKIDKGSLQSGSQIQFEVFGESDGIQSDREKGSFLLPDLKNPNSVTRKPSKPKSFNFAVIGNSALVTVRVSTGAAQMPSKAFLTSESLRIKRSRPIVGDLTTSKAIYEIPITPSMLGKKYPVLAYLSNEKGESKSLRGVITIPGGFAPPSLPSASSTQSRSPRTVVCGRANQTRAFEGTKCPPGWKKR
jgi:hypothetical protein